MVSQNTTQMLHRYSILTFQFSLKIEASDAVSWLMKQYKWTEDQAVFFGRFVFGVPQLIRVGRLMRTRHIIHHVDSPSVKFSNDGQWWRFQVGRNSFSFSRFFGFLRPFLPSSCCLLRLRRVGFSVDAKKVLHSHDP